MNTQDIENKEFTVTRFKEGYDPGEVDAFLDEVAAHITSLQNEIQEHKSKTAKLQRELAEANRLLAAYGEEPTRVTPAAPVSASATRILEAAQKTADDVIGSAQVDAEAIRLDARSEANRLITEAGDEAEAKRKAAEAHAYRAETKLKELRAKHESLRVFLVQQLENGLESLKGAPETNGS